MRINQVVSFALALLFAGAVGAQDAKIVRVTGPDAPIPGAIEISDYTGPIPASAGGEPPQMPGWPKTVGGSGNFSPWRGVVFEDLDNDGDLEIIMSSTDNRLYAWHYSGTSVAGFPRTTIGMCQYAPSVADLDDDGDLEIVQCTRGATGGGRLYAFDHQGNVLSGFPININNNNVEASPTLVDLDDDGTLEIIVGERAWPIGFLHVFDHDGTEWGGNWPVQLDHVPTGTAAVGDVDNDDSLEIFYYSFDSMYLIEADGTVVSGWPRQIANAKFSYQSAALADLDGNGDLEIAVCAHREAAGCYVFHHDGTLLPGWPKFFGTWSYCPPTVTDLEGDGALEIIAGRAGVFFTVSNAFWVWDVGGNTRAGFPYRTPPSGGGSDGPITTADIDGDGVLEIFADNNVSEGGRGFLFGVDANGNDLPGFPLRPVGFTYLNSATIADVDGDGDFELGVVSYHDAGVDVNLYDLPDLSARTNRDWPAYHARNSRGGLYAPVSGGPAELTGFEIVTGALLDGTIDDLRRSDNSYVHTRSGFGEAISDLHKMEMIVSAVTAVDSPTSLDLSVEARIDEPSGTARLFLRNRNTGQFDQVAQYSIGMTEETFTIEDIDATNYVSESGEIALLIKHNVFRPFLAFTFESFVDWVEIVVE